LRFCNENTKRRDLAGLARQLGKSHKDVLEADAAATQVQRDFYAALRRRGQELLAVGQLSSEERPLAVVVGRSYNICDLAVSLGLPDKLRKMGVLAIPMELLPLQTVDLRDCHSNMYWRSGQDILAAARLVRQHPKLQAIYMNSFMCGPDSFLVNYFRRIMRGKPFLELEIDDHTADAGIVTRCEAFLESLQMQSRGMA
jgi:predicted nucleotide-binding protein (sugar kinase/HSP70/actin superfamily)